MVRRCSWAGGWHTPPTPSPPPPQHTSTPPHSTHQGGQLLGSFLVHLQHPVPGRGVGRPRRGARSLPSIPRVRAVLRPILQANRQLRELREIAKGVTKQLPDAIQNATAKIDEYARGMISGTGSTLFEELGFYYIGPVDGHNLQDLVDVLTGGGQAGGSLLKAPSRGHGRAPL